MKVLLFEKLITRKPDLWRLRGLYTHFEVEKTSIFFMPKSFARMCPEVIEG